MVLLRFPHLPNNSTAQRYPGPLGVLLLCCLDSMHHSRLAQHIRHTDKLLQVLVLDNGDYILDILQMPLRLYSDRNL
jgi:hypothetical protein